MHGRSISTEAAYESATHVDGASCCEAGSALLQAVMMFQHLQWAVQRELMLNGMGFCSPVAFTSCLQAIDF